MSPLVHAHVIARGTYFLGRRFDGKAASWVREDDMPGAERPEIERKPWF